MFQYARPTSLQETFSLLRDVPDARLLHGGTDLLVGLRKRTVRTPLVVDLKRVADLPAGIAVTESRTRIGARAVLREVTSDPRIRRHYPALVEAALVVGSIQIRNRASLAGNLCNASPAADTVPPLLAHGASVELIGPSGSRRLALEDFLLGPGRTALQLGELVAAIELSIPTEPTGSAFGRLTRRRGVDLATVNLACTVTASGVTRFAFGAVGPRAFAMTDEGGTLSDPGASAAARDEALSRLIAPATPISNVRASREYRQEMLLVLSRRALAAAQQRLAEATDAG